MMRPFYRPPAIYLQTLARRRQDALRAAERQARAQQQRIAEAIDTHGERMSDEGRGLLTGLAETLRGVAAAIRRQR